MDDILLNKAAIIERCLNRALEEFSASPELDNFTHQDAFILNIERACQAAIDMAMHIVAKNHLGVPHSNSHAFDLLMIAGKIDSSMADSLKSIVGFRNIAVHEYQNINMDILKYVARDGYKDLVNFCRQLGLTIVIDSDHGK